MSVALFLLVHIVIQTKARQIDSRVACDRLVFCLNLFNIAAAIHVFFRKEEFTVTLKIKGRE